MAEARRCRYLSVESTGKKRRSRSRGEKRAVLVTGANSLLGQHLVRQLHASADQLNLTHIHTYDAAKFRSRLPSYEERLKLRSWSGSPWDSERLWAALEGAVAVFHLWEQADFTLLPDEERMEAMNVGGTELVVGLAAEAGVSSFVLGSSIWAMASGVWPSVMNPETAEVAPPSELAFPVYGRSKQAAEGLLFAESRLASMAVRLGPLYGEGDLESLIVTSLKAAAANGGVLPVIGDGGGFLQFAYAGNVAAGLVLCLGKLQSEPELRGEVVFLLDETPIQPLYELLLPILEARGMRLATKATPFLAAYAPLRLLHLIGRALGRQRLLRLFAGLNRLPSHSLLFTHYYYWYSRPPSAHSNKQTIARKHSTRLQDV